MALMSYLVACDLIIQPVRQLLILFNLLRKGDLNTALTLSKLFDLRQGSPQRNAALLF